MQSFDDQPADLDTSLHRRPGTVQREWGRWVELSLLLGGALALAFWSVRSGGAPTVIAALLGVLPAIVGLQHGFLAAVGGVIVGFLAVWLAPSGPLLESSAALLAPYALALAVGHYADRTRRTRRQLEERVQSQGRQLEQLFRAHSVLRASHAQLEERLAAREWSLEAAVREAERQVGARDLAGAAGALLELLTSQGRVAAASLYVARGGELPLRADARLGPAPVREEPGRLVRMAFTHGTLVSLERDVAVTDADENVLLALPLCTTGGHVVGVVAVHELPFVAFHDAHFRLLATLIAPFSDALARKVEAGDVTARLTGTPGLPPPTRALARLRQTPLLPPLAARAELHAPSLSDVLRAAQSVANGSASDSDFARPVDDEEETTVSDSDADLTVEVDIDGEGGSVLSVAEVVVVEFDIGWSDAAANAPSEAGAAASIVPASANTNAAPVESSEAAPATEAPDGARDAPVAPEPAAGEPELPFEPARESEVEIVLTRPARTSSNDADDDDDDPTRLHAGPPGTVIS